MEWAKTKGEECLDLLRPSEAGSGLSDSQE